VQKTLVIGCVHVEPDARRPLRTLRLHKRRFDEAVSPRRTPVLLLFYHCFTTALLQFYDSFTKEDACRRGTSTKVEAVSTMRTPSPLPALPRNDIYIYIYIYIFVIYIQHTYMRRYIQTYIHTYIHTCIQSTLRVEAAVFLCLHRKGTL